MEDKSFPKDWPHSFILPKHYGILNAPAKSVLSVVFLTFLNVTLIHPCAHVHSIPSSSRSIYYQVSSSSINLKPLLPPSSQHHVIIISTGELQEHPASPFLFLPSLEWSLNANQKLKVPGRFPFVPNRKTTPKSMSYSKSDLKTGPSPFSSLTSHLSFLYTLLSTDTTFDSINMPINFPPQGLSTCCSLCLEHSGPWPSAG